MISSEVHIFDSIYAWPSDFRNNTIFGYYWKPGVLAYLLHRGFIIVL